MTKQLLYMLLCATVVALSLYNLGEHVPSAWRTPLRASSLTALVVRSALVAWVGFSTALVLVTVLRWLT